MNTFTSTAFRSTSSGMLTWFLMLTSCALLLPLQALAGTRLALVIGNSSYADRPLRNPGNDATDVAAALKDLGFELYERKPQLNLNRRSFNAALGGFVRQASGADLVVIYYSGHGLQASGDNYLVPTDARIEEERDIRTEGIRLADLLNDLDDAKVQRTVVILDACRDNPFNSRAKSLKKGLARIEPQGATLIAFATAEGLTADDGTGRHGVYTEALLQNLRDRRLDVRDVLDETALAVGRANKGQRPRVYGDTALFKGVYLGGAGTQVASLQAVPVQAVAGVGTVFKDCDVCPEMVVLPPGRFTMGSPDSEAERDKDEGPQHEVTINYKLAVGRYSITRDQFAAFVNDKGYQTDAERKGGCYVWSDSQWKQDAQRNWRNPGYEQTGRHPVVCVSWNDAQAYTQWIAGKTGKGYRLLSEAEWEYAARGGRSTRYYWGDDPGHTEQCGYANGGDQTARQQINGTINLKVASCSDRFAHTAPVGSFKPNAFGLYDMAGNVWQWVGDMDHGNYSGAPADGSVWTSGGDSKRRVLRGGSWNYMPSHLRSAIRGMDDAALSHSGDGFRIAISY